MPVSPVRLPGRDVVPTTNPGPATRHARPVALASRTRGRPDDPPTDPYGFPPLPTPPLLPPPDPLEAAALAAAFAADYLSWDEDDPKRRGRVLTEYLAAPIGDPALLGWGGVGRQRAEFALPGPVRPGGDGRVLVDVRVRVTPYRAVGDREPDATGTAPDTEVPGVPAAAPAPNGRGWRGCASSWIRLIVPVVRTGDRLTVEVGDHDEAPRVRPVVDDDPLAEPDPTPDGAW